MFKEDTTSFKLTDFEISENEIEKASDLIAVYR